MSETRLSAEVRTEFGKGGARRTRRAGKIPAVIYGHGAEPRHISLPAREFDHAVRKGGANVLLTLSIEGKDELAIPKAITRHPIKPVYEHVDLIAVRRGEKITVDVPVHVVGDVVAGGQLAQEHTSVSVEAEATHIPTSLEVSIDGLEIGSHVTAGELTLPSGATLVTDPDTLIVAIGATAVAELEVEGEEAAEAAPEAPAAEAEAGEESAE